MVSASSTLLRQQNNGRLPLNLAKCSVLALILRIIGSRTGMSRPLCIGVMVLSVAWGIGSCLAFLINCRADTLLTLDNAKQCPNQDARWAVITAIDIFTEILAWLLVVQMSWTVSMSFTRKCQVVMAFSFRIPLIALSAFHLAFFSKYPASDEPQFAITESLLFQQAMISWSLISATVPNLKNFLKSFSIGMGFPLAFDLTMYGSSNVYALQSLENNRSKGTSSALAAAPGVLTSALDYERPNIEPRGRPHNWRLDHVSNETTVARNNREDMSEEGEGSRTGSQEMIINKEVAWNCHAHYSELPEIAHVMAKAFWEDNLFGQLIHPHRNKHPDDVDLYWLRRARVNFWDYRWKWLVAVSKDESGQEVIAGIAQWARLGDGGQKMECWYLDPRNLLKPLSSVAMKIHGWVWPSRASDPKEEDIVERAYPFFDGIWSGKRGESWYLEALAVRPDFQGRNVGRKLVEWGLERAEADGVCASVVSALGKDGFYTKCGFEEQHGSAKQGDGNPLADIEGANIYWRWPRAVSSP
ncbi:hypothetical protein BGZ63DRAFT_415097 [Mariannaea sp. PMI_226]|nr:hypothetical protein BGZ63DRAFT_415097 [Mariannaea sp. PMI_226]